MLGAFANEVAVGQFVRRLVYSTMVGNADMHLKNWSLIYRDPRQAELSPAQDLLSTTAYVADEATTLHLGRAKHWDDLALSVRRRLGENAFVGGDAGRRADAGDRGTRSAPLARPKAPALRLYGRGRSRHRQPQIVPATNPRRRTARQRVAPTVDRLEPCNPRTAFLAGLVVEMTRDVLGVAHRLRVKRFMLLPTSSTLLMGVLGQVVNLNASGVRRRNRRSV